MSRQPRSSNIRFTAFSFFKCNSIIVQEMRDLTPTSLESSVEVEEEDGSFTEEEDTALPLTFNDSRDLHWKLAKADILRSERALPSQRPASVTLFSGTLCPSDLFSSSRLNYRWRRKRFVMADHHST